MKKVTRRAISALLVAALIITGTAFYCWRYITDGADWASFFGNENVTGTSVLTDRNGVALASETGGKVTFADDYATRVACYQTVGDMEIGGEKATLEGELADLYRQWEELSD